MPLAPVRLLLVVALLLMACPAGAAIPQNPQAYTNAQYTQDVLAFQRQTLAETYERIGSRDPRWDQAVLDLLEQNARRNTDAVVDGHDLGLEMKPYRWIREQAKRLVELGCDEPLVLFHHGAALRKAGRKEQALPLLKQGYEQMLARGYPSLRIALMGSQVYLAMPEGPERDAFFPVTQENWARALLDPQTSRAGLRCVIDIDDPSSNFKWLTRYYEVAQQMEAPDPWAYELLCGIYHTRAGWEARGGGWASTVTEEGWDGFAEHLAKAREHLKRAWELDPAQPHAATEMIAITMAGHGDPGDTPRLWFDRAVEAQFDFLEAYDKLMWALRPRWGGSHDQMLAFAQECVETGRFETEVPGKAMKVLRGIVDDYEGQWTIVDDPRIWSIAEAYFEGMIAEPANAGRADWFRSNYAACAWRFEQFDRSRQALAGLEGEYRWAAAGYYSGTQDRVLDQTGARTGVAAKLVAAGDAALERGDMAAAEKHYQGVRTFEGADDLTVRYALHRLQQIRWQARLDAGEAVLLVPDEDLRPSKPGTLSGFDVERGNWETVDDTLVATSKGVGMEARLAVPPGKRWRLEVTIDVGMNDRPHFQAAGVIFYWENYFKNWQYVFRPGQGHKMTRDWNYGEWQGEPGEVVQFVAERWDDRQAVLLDGELVYHDAARGDADGATLGLGGFRLYRDAVVLYRKPTLQRITQRPAWLDEPRTH